MIGCGGDSHSSALTVGPGPPSNCLQVNGSSVGRRDVLVCSGFEALALLDADSGLELWSRDEPGYGDQEWCYDPVMISDEATGRALIVRRGRFSDQTGVYPLSVDTSEC